MRTVLCRTFCLGGTEYTEAAKTFLTRLLGEYDVPEVIHTGSAPELGSIHLGTPELERR